jgi:hypothetical protein
MTELTLTDADIETGGFAVMEAEEDSDGSDSDDSDGTDGDSDGTGGSDTDAGPFRRRRRDAGGRLARCVEPLDAAEFLAEYWEQKPLAVPRGEEGRYDDLLSVADVERLVSDGGMRTPGLRMVKEGGTIAESEYAREISWRPKPFTGTVDPDRVAKAFADGATIVLQALHHTWLPLARFCRALEAELGSGVQANSYYTPRRSQGFAVHHDTHDVFVLQVAGEKHWRMYDPVLELPLKAQRWRPRWGGDRPVGADPPCGRRALSPSRLVARRADLRHGLAAHHRRRERAHVDRRVPRRAGRVPGRRRLPEVGVGGRRATGRPRREALQPARRRRRAAPCPGQVRRHSASVSTAKDAREADSVTAGTPLERRATVIADLNGTTLSFEGKHVEFPEQVQEVLEALLELDGSFTAADLPVELDDEGRLVLVRRLIREGFLRRSAADA